MASTIDQSSKRFAGVSFRIARHSSNKVRHEARGGPRWSENENCAGSNQHRINCALRMPAVTADSKDRDVYGVGCGQRIPLGVKPTCPTVSLALQKIVDHRGIYAASPLISQT